ncbi:MAG: hypothetical protein WCK21_05975, partial [Actinomycetota bacterium]
ALLEPLNGGHLHSSKVTPRVPQNTGWSWASRQDYGLATAEGNRAVLTMRAKAGREVAVPEVCAHLLACPIQATTCPHDVDKHVDIPVSIGRRRW